MRSLIDSVSGELNEPVITFEQWSALHLVGNIVDDAGLSVVGVVALLPKKRWALRVSVRVNVSG